jgi:2-C-methyl-D-erythritol 2,4-cyclodiphosphate synthase
VLLRECISLVKQKGFKVSNIDATVIAQKPKLAPFIEQMVKNIASDCELEIDSVNVKATTEEGLGFTGNLEGISAHAVCILE